MTPSEAATLTARAQHLDIIASEHDLRSAFTKAGAAAIRAQIAAAGHTTPAAPPVSDGTPTVTIRPRPSFIHPPPAVPKAPPTAPVTTPVTK